MKTNLLGLDAAGLPRSSRRCEKPRARQVMQWGTSAAKTISRA
jgi:hypothetical protein